MSTPEPPRRSTPSADDRGVPGRRLAATVPAVLWEAEATSARMTFVSASAADVTGHEPSAWLDEPAFWEMHLHPADLAEAAHAVARLMASGGTVSIEYRFRLADGTYGWFEDTIRLVEDPEAGPHLAGVMVPSSRSGNEARELADRRADAATGAVPDVTVSSLFRSVVDGLAEGVYCVDAHRRITYWNHGAERLTGKPSAGVLGRQCFDGVFCHVDDQGRSQCQECPLVTAIARGTEREQVMWLQHGAGHMVRVKVRSSPIRDELGRIVGAVETFGEATAEPATDRRSPALSTDPFFDPLTGLPDRRLLDAVLTARQDDLDRFWIPYGVLVVEVERLAAITSARGPVAAGEVIAVAARTLRAALRSGDVVVRSAPTRFAVGVGMIEGDGLAALADRLAALMRQTAVPGTVSPIPVSVTVGAALARRGETPDDLLVRAHDALAAARQRGRDRGVSAGPPEPGGAPRTLGVRRGRGAQLAAGAGDTPRTADVKR